MNNQKFPTYSVRICSMPFHIRAKSSYQDENYIYYFDVTLDTKGALEEYKVILLNLATFALECYKKINDKNAERIYRLMTVEVKE